MVQMYTKKTDKQGTKLYFNSLPGQFVAFFASTPQEYVQIDEGKQNIVHQNSNPKALLAKSFGGDVDD